MLAYSRRTVDTYISIVKKYLKYYGDVPPILDPLEEAEVAVEFIEEYSSDPRSRQVAAYAIKNLYKYLGRPDIASRIPEPRGSGWVPSVIPLSEDEIKYIIMSLSSKRDRAILCLAYDLALRRSEVTLLKRTEFNPSTCTILVYRMKRPKGQVQPESMKISPWCCRLVQEYLETRNDNLEWLFISKSKYGIGPASRELVRRTFKKLEDILGVQGLRFHQLRHTRLTHLAEKTGDVLALAKFAGHRNPQSTMIYIHLGAVSARKRIEEKHE